MFSQKGDKVVSTLDIAFKMELLADGTFRYCVLEPDTRKHGRMRLLKRRETGSGYFFTPPPWDKLHDLTYADVVSNGAVISPFGPIEHLIRAMQYTFFRKIPNRGPSDLGGVSHNDEMPH
jgi:hypothetical protein